MTKRTTRNASPLFRKVLTEAETELAQHAERAANFKHRGLRGNTRAAALAEFLTSHLPSFFRVGKGEARDFKDRVTSELDLFIYDHMTAAPIQTELDHLIVPAEALYAVIEVKSVLTADEMDICFAAARKVRSLQPFKQEFIAPPENGQVEKDRCRCPYFVFAYDSNLSMEDWAKKEYQRAIDSANRNHCGVDLLDRIIVLDRGIIRPQVGVALLQEDSPSLFLEFYLHLINFLMRERKRRPAIDWMAYTSRSKWTKLTRVDN